MSTLICHTDGCPNQDEPIELELTVTDLSKAGGLVYVDQVVCGLCGQPITDIDPPVTLGVPA